ncbi:Transposase [Carbonactinospora thermoautotrophica]|uniref:Transposase n=1 Tax=Carbonactinospora thermoautotrophica TaxID=1469144 RepID=A0A132MVH3_9ACTN|nr:Transposase [Carbonactinospora thermoautotrophica]
MRVPRRAFRYRFHPTPQQAGLLNRTFGCVRYVYRRSPWRPTSRGTPLLRRDRALTAFKADLEHAWLQEVSSVPLQQALRHGAFVAFWDKHAKYSRFKAKKRGKASATFTRSVFRRQFGARPLRPRRRRPGQVTGS